MIYVLCRVTSSLAAYLFGGVTVPGAAGGIFIGGLIVKVRFNRVSGAVL